MHLTYSVHLLSSAHMLICQMDRNEKRVFKCKMFKCCWNFGRTEFSLRRQCTVGCYNLSADCGVSAWSKVDWRRAPFGPPGRCAHGWKCSACQWHDYNWSATNCQICSWVSEVIIRYNPSCYYQRAGFNKVCALWVPRMLTSDKKQVRLATSRDNLSL